jgi:hypothetical protein
VVAVVHEPIARRATTLRVITNALRSQPNLEKREATMTGTFLGRFRHRDGKVCEPVRDDQTEFEPVADTSCKASEEFARNSERKNGIDKRAPFGS